MGGTEVHLIRTSQSQVSSSSIANTHQLFESNAKPHLYQFAAKFYQKLRDSQPKFYRPSETPQKFWTEYENFKAFFLKKTSIGWDQRLIQISLDESLFQYKAPVSPASQSHGTRR